MNEWKTSLASRDELVLPGRGRIKPDAACSIGRAVVATTSERRDSGTPPGSLPARGASRLSLFSSLSERSLEGLDISLVKLGGTGTTG